MKALARLVCRFPRPGFRGSRFAVALRCLGWFFAPGPLASAAPIIAEFMASNHVTLADDDGDYSDWIEIYNPDATPADLSGWYLTDSAKKKTKWQFPAVSLAPQAALIVFASGKDRRDPARPLHTNFSLDADGEYLGLLRPDGATIATEFAPLYPPQRADISYGITQPDAASGEEPQLGYFAVPTPGARNGPASALILPSSVAFSLPSGPFASDTTLALTGAAAGETIRYTLVTPSAMGAVAAEPTATSPAYTTPLPLTGSVMIRAATFTADGSRRGLSSVARYLRLDSSFTGFVSSLPVMVLDTHGAGPFVPYDPDRPAWFDLLAPAGSGPTFAGTPLVSSGATAHVRGSSSAIFPKQSYSVQLLDASGRGDSQSLLGLAADDTWDVVAPWNYDRTFLHNAYVYSLSRSLGRWAPHTKFIETFVTGSGAPLGAADYAGVSMLTERLTIDSAHVNLASLSPSDVTAPNLTGGYILKIDVAGSDDFTFTTPHLADWSPQSNLIVYRPAATALPAAQRSYISGYVQAMEHALYADAASGWATHNHLLYLDRASWVDYHLIQVLSGNVDALERSFYFTKDRNGKLVAGPQWDFDRSLGSADPRNAAWNQWNSPDAGDVWNYGWWGVLTRDPDFMQAWIDRWQALRRHELSADQLNTLADTLAAQIGPDAAARDAARWSNDVSRFPGGWAGEIAQMKSWVTNRAAWIDSHFVPTPGLETDGILLSATAPAGAQLAYTLDGSDPRGPNGQLALTVRLAAGPLTVDASALLCVRAWNPTMTAFPSSPWSAPLLRTDAQTVGAGSNPAFQSRLANLSTLVHLDPASGVPLTGLVVTGASVKAVLIRAVGPALRQFGVGDALPDPVLSILDSTGHEIARNAGWNLGPDALDLPRLSTSAGAFQLPTDSADSALVAQLPPGSYTILVSSASGAMGSALAEVYELDPTGSLASLSTCATVNAASPVLSGGFTVRGSAPKKFLIRAVGPALAALGVTGTLADPVLSLTTAGGLVTGNDDWGSPAAGAADATAVAAAAIACGAFVLPSGSADSAALVTLAPGAYTAQVSGKAGATGLVLLEIYGVP